MPTASPSRVRYSVPLSGAKRSDVLAAQHQQTEDSVGRATADRQATSSAGAALSSNQLARVEHRLIAEVRIRQALREHARLFADAENSLRGSPVCNGAHRRTVTAPRRTLAQVAVQRVEQMRPSSRGPAAPRSRDARAR